MIFPYFFIIIGTHIFRDIEYAVLEHVKVFEKFQSVSRTQGIYLQGKLHLTLFRIFRTFAECNVIGVCSYQRYQARGENGELIRK